MNKKFSTEELFDMLKEKIIPQEGRVVCGTCGGLQIKMLDRNGKFYIEHCRSCHDGYLRECEFCGKKNKTSMCDCEGYILSIKQRDIEKEKERFDKAEKISFDNYDGYFIWNDRVIGKDEMMDYLHDMICSGEELPDYLYATRKEMSFDTIDLQDIIMCNSEDGYEEMYDRLNTSAKELIDAQKLINKWQEDNKDTMMTYFEDYSKVILLDDPVDRLKLEIG